MTDKINEEDRASIYAAMADMEEEETAERKARNPFTRGKDSGKSVSVPLGDGKSADVPSMEYVQGLERIIRAQAQTIEKFERAFHRIDAKLRTQRAHINGQSGRINDVNRELDQKIDRRD
jgi:hypothetical protein